MKHIIKFLTLSIIIWCLAVEASQDGSKVLVTMDGKPLITEQQLNQAIDHERELATFDPFQKNLDIEKDKFLEKMVQQEVVNKYMADNKIDISSKYQQELKKMVDTLKSGLNSTYFQEAPDEKKEKFYTSTSSEAAQEVVNTYISDNKIDISPSYQSKLKLVVDSAKSVLNTEYFTEQVISTSNDPKLRKFYDATKGAAFYFASEFESEPKQLENKVNAEIERLKKEYKIVIVK